MKKFLLTVRSNIPFLLTVLLFDAFFAFLLWITDPPAMHRIALALGLFSLLAFVAVILFLMRKESRAKEAMAALAEEQDVLNAEQLIRYLGPSFREPVEQLLRKLQEESSEISALQTKVTDHEDYVEEWAHEAKTPIALLTLVLDNHRDSLPEDVLNKTEYARSRLNEYVEQMLLYSRVKSSRKDYLFEDVSLRDVINEVLQDYRPLLEEKDFTVMNLVKDDVCYCDRRGLRFMLGQFVSNSVKYCGSEPVLSFSFSGRSLSVSDNGIGVSPADLPFIFERGFTGNTGEFRNKATGMGLYLASRVAEDMNLSLEADSPAEGGFTVSVVFPGS